jgi:hypothetical protein
MPLPRGGVLQCPARREPAGPVRHCGSEALQRQAQAFSTPVQGEDRRSSRRGQTVQAGPTPRAASTKCTPPPDPAQQHGHDGPADFGLAAPDVAEAAGTLRTPAERGGRSTRPRALRLQLAAARNNRPPAGNNPRSRRAGPRLVGH